MKQVESSAEAHEPQTPASRSQQLLRRLGWSAFGLFCLICFTLLKLPEDRVKNWVEGTISAQLAEKRVRFTAKEGHLSLFFGLSYTMKEVDLFFPPPLPAAHLKQIGFSPSILPLLWGRMGGSLRLDTETGHLKATFSNRATSFSLAFVAQKLELEKLGVLPFLAGFQMNAALEGEGSFSGDLANPSSIGGSAEVSLSKLSLDAQSIAGFQIPKSGISEAVAKIQADKGKAVIKTFRVGKPNAAPSSATTQAPTADDLMASITGDVVLGKSIEMSQLNLKVNFALSETLMKSFVLLDALIGSGKQSNGSYSFSLTGPLYAPVAAPLSEER